MPMPLSLEKKEARVQAVHESEDRFLAGVRQMNWVTKKLRRPKLPELIDFDLTTGVTRRIRSRAREGIAMIAVRWSSLLVRVFSRSLIVDGPTGQQIGIHHDLSRTSQAVLTRLSRFKRVQVERQREIFVGPM